MERNEYNNVNDSPTPTFGRSHKPSVNVSLKFPKSSTFLTSFINSTNLDKHKKEKSKSKSKSKSKKKIICSSEKFGLQMNNPFDEFLQKKIVLRNDYDHKNTKQFLKDKELVFEGFEVFYNESKK